MEETFHHMLTEPFLGGILNYPILFGIQVYFYLFIAAILAIVASEILWRVGYWQPMLPFQGLWEAYRDRSNAAFITSIGLNWNLMREGAAKLIFDPSDYKFVTDSMGRWVRFRAWLFKSDFSTQIARLLQQDWDDKPIVHIGQVPTDLIIDAYGYTSKESPERKEMKRIAGIWNEAHENDQIHTIGKFMKYVREKKIIVDESKFRTKFTAPWSRIDSAFPLEGDRSDAAWGGFIRQLATDLKKLENADLNKWALVILAFSGAICLLMAAIHFFT